MSGLPDGLYDLLLDEQLAQWVQALSSAGHARVESLAPAERRRRLIEAIARRLPELLDAAAGPVEAGGDPQDAQVEQRELAFMNQLLSTLRQEGGAKGWSLRAPVQVLRGINRSGPPPVFPPTGLTAPWLFTAGRADPSLLTELRAELASADRVDVLMSFITWSGLRKLRDLFEAVTAVGADGEPRTRLRILTTTYTGATEARAVEVLAAMPGVELRISLDGRRSRLHAKAWIFQRSTRFGTAFVGSANMSRAALMGGIEWTVKFTQTGQAELFAAAQAHFEALWNDREFQAFDPRDERQVAQLRGALREQSAAPGSGLPVNATWFDLQPKAYQQEMLERLAAERRHGRSRNLLVAATGTGKTVVAAFDYLRQVGARGSPPRLLYVAHRVEILNQALATFRQVLRRPDFGDLLHGNREPASLDHLFATIQSAHPRLLSEFPPDYWDMVVIDECHHLPAASFSGFARAIAPRILLGLTATPERNDSESVSQFFQDRPDGSPAVELRLWDALDQQLLAPFEYYATADGSDFRSVPWGRGRQEAEQLSSVVTGNAVRARLIRDTLTRYVPRLEDLKALAFCVDIAHAKYMAAYFNDSGLVAWAVTSQSGDALRAQAPRRLAAGEVQVLCTADLYNEGIDIPEVNAVLFLRPTQSPVVFQQQLGRGLRLMPGKDSCLVLDFVAQVGTEFRFDRLYRAITGLTRRQLTTELEHGFSSLPPGCHIQFDRVARERVLDALRLAGAQSWRRLAAELAGFAAAGRSAPVTLQGFLREQFVDLEEVYRTGSGTASPTGWTALQRAAGLVRSPPDEDEEYLGRRFAAALHLDDPLRIALLGRAAREGVRLWPLLDVLERRLLQMLAHQIVAAPRAALGGEQFLQYLEAKPLLRAELLELATSLDERCELEPELAGGLPQGWPLVLHAAYQRAEVLSAVGAGVGDRRATSREGVLALHEPQVEVLFITLDKREGFHSRIAYHDYAISPELFHWQTQNATGPDTKVGQRYIHSRSNGWRFLPFVRRDPEAPFRCLGLADLDGEPEGSRPMSLTLRLRRALPLALFRCFTVLRA